jgi:rubrerythrin
MGELLAHALALELESAECYRALADSMAAHNNRPAAALFEELALSAEAYAASLQQRAGAKALPELAPWEHHCAPTGGAADCMAKAHYQMTAYQALELAIRNERRSHSCLLRMIGEISVPEVYRGAEEIAADKGRQVVLLAERLARAAVGHMAPPEDLDPPNVPE